MLDSFPRHPFIWTAAVAIVFAGPAVGQPQWSISPPLIKESKPPADDASKNAVPTPLRKEEAREKQEFARLTIERIFVEGSADDAGRKKREADRRFANALNQGNPEVPGGKIRHGAYYDGFVYWGGDPLSFFWLNTIDRLRNDR
jgi:hypothetical protein